MDCFREWVGAAVVDEVRIGQTRSGRRPIILFTRHLLLTLIIGVGGCAGLVSSVAITPGPVKAGEDTNLTVTLDKAPNFEGGEIRVMIVGPEKSNATLPAKIDTHPGVGTYHIAIHIPPSAPGGTWTVSQVMFFTGVKEIPLRAGTTFQVLARPDIILPTTAQIIVSPSQAQLLRSAAAQLQSRIQMLKADLAAGRLNASNSPSLNDILSRRIDMELGFLRATEATFHSLATPEAQPDSSASIFFADLRVSYNEAKVQLRSQIRARTMFVPASLALPQDVGEHSQYPMLAQAVFRVFEQNELAYKTVADTGNLTFDLEVSTTPQGATISYRRRGDAYHQNPNQTNSVIKGLPYAIWTVRLQEPGYQDEEREHDPFREPNHVINVQLRH